VRTALIASAAAVCAACTSSAAPSSPSAVQVAEPPAAVPLTTLQDLMRNEFDASADPIWEAVGTISTSEGTKEREPRSEADWLAVRQHAVVLLEATNLLLIPGRNVSLSPFPADGPGVFDSGQIQDRLDNERGQFDSLTLAFRAVASRVLLAVDRRDPQALSAAGEALDEACEACHRANWYPHEVIPALPAEPPPPAY
jgi:hypothetical protein